MPKTERIEPLRPSAIQQPTRWNPEEWERHELYQAIRDAIFALPFYFKTETVISGISANDIFTLNTAFSATIESQVMDTLNKMRNVWCKEEEYKLYGFVRQSQTYPDIVLKKLSDNSEQPLIGIELKSWYLLSKERVPSFRFSVTPSACSNQDLLVVVPWTLSNVLSGSPVIFTPYIEQARYAAEYEKYWWENIRKTKSAPMVSQPANAAPYPKKSAKITGKPESDGGGNFGRFARTKLMENYCNASLEQEICGIKAKHWITFFAAFRDNSEDDKIGVEIGKLINGIEKENDGKSLEQSDSAVIANMVNEFQQLSGKN